MPDALLVTDRHGRVTKANGQASRLFGGPVVGRRVARLLVGEEDGQVHDGARRLFALRRRGAPLPVEVTARRLDGDQVVASVRDISHAWQAERAMQRHAARLEATNRELLAFGHAVSHDLRGPLVALGHMAELLMRRIEDRLDGDERILMDLIGSSSRHMVSILEGLGALSEVTEGELECTKTDLAALARLVVERLAAEQPDRRVRLEAPSELCVQGDPRLLAVLVENLVGNAWKFSRDTDAVIRVGRRGQDLFVEDNGPGFPPERAEDLFRPFYRLHHPEHVEGRGIGLATVQRIVRRHGGVIRAEAPKTGGARFVFRLSP